ncbi:MAG TPA: FMN-binding protein [Pirellulaceae bacterium]|nr:FMN-binding protein [Pirellulaceae bacterium]
MQIFFRCLCAAAFFAASAASVAAATIEFLNGTTIQCTVLAKDDTSVTIETVTSGAKSKRTIPLTNIHKVTINTKEYVINERPAAGSSKTSSPKRANPKGSSKSSGASLDDAPDQPAASTKELRSKAEIDALIDELGRTPPDWFETTPLNYPQSLDLSWPDKPPGGWDNQKNVGQYVWDIINHNPSKWREGVRLMHHLLTLHKDDPAKRTKVMNELGRMYHNLHQDYARAAFWWRQAGVDKANPPRGTSVHLAECYWRLGNKQMAVDMLRKMNSIPYDGIKLWADMGETDKALSIAEVALKSPGAQKHFALLYAADACRVGGRTNDALKYYQQLLALSATGQQKGQIERCQKRAAATVEAIKLYDLSDVKKVADGSYQDEAIGYEGPVRVQVVVKSGRIESVNVTQHREKQFYSAMTDTPAKIIAKQSVKGVDATSSATITSEAIINATAKALAKGAK